MDTKFPLSTLFPKNEANIFREFTYELHQESRKHLLRNEILQLFESFCINHEGCDEIRQGNHLERFFSKTQAMLLCDNYLILLYRPQMGHYRFYGIHNGDDQVDCLTAEKYLNEREKVTGTSYIPPEKKLTVDFEPFQNSGPVIRDYRKIGSGQKVVNTYMAGRLQADPDRWHSYFSKFLKIHTISNEQMMVDEDIIRDHDHLFNALQKAIPYLEEHPPKTSIKQASSFLKELGFRDGFGSTIGRTLDTMRLLSDLLEVPNPDDLEEFISRIPMISKVAIISPHGWFGQENVLGRPDTGGQVVYILDQVKALEKHLMTSLKASGLSVTPKIVVLTRLIPKNEGTTSNQRLEKIHGTFNGWILRVPFRDGEMKVIPHWISRFELWPYLEDFAVNGKNEVMAELGGKPDLIIGNYSDGNLVASLLSSWLGVTQCNIAHALEKLKYPNSALYWEEMEKDYHFSLQYTADLISMNMADMIITSTSQEICGTDTTQGQYESYSLFSMPQLFNVVHGINLFHPKFNVVSPGADDTVFFPFDQQKRRHRNRVEELSSILFEKSEKDILGSLEDPGKTPIFTISRLDKIKNISGLVESFGKNRNIQEIANLVIITGTIHPKEAKTQEEGDEIRRIYESIGCYGLEGKIRWLGLHLSKVDTGEVYRIIADRRGVFVQPAWYEAFGLTIIEAMASGLPVFATRLGGPLEIIEDGITGFLIDTHQADQLIKPVQKFIKDMASQPTLWDRISSQAIRRVKENYTWKLYAEKLIQYAKLYGFWNYSDLAKDKKNTTQYCNLLFHLIYKNRANRMLG